MCPPNIRMVCPYLKLHHFWYCSIATQCLKTISNCLLQEWKFFFFKCFWNPMEHFIIANHVVEHADVTFGVKVPDLFYKNWWRFWRWELQYFRLFLPLFNSHYNEKTLYFLLCSFLISWGCFPLTFQMKFSLNIGCLSLLPMNFSSETKNYQLFKLFDLIAFWSHQSMPFNWVSPSEHLSYFPFLTTLSLHWPS